MFDLNEWKPKDEFFIRLGTFSHKIKFLQREFKVPGGGNQFKNVLRLGTNIACHLLVSNMFISSENFSETIH